ncbi:hydrogen peroxide-inducible genes activator [Rhizobium paknamense]|uniref:LysR family hydrogen peroxide-inducible transcriptional activator n=1 Tax=Rhizobium paknamense TaxID=1206817 RepID=A0ABU0IGT4_9HYPH|nr:hydrogen peroxide-inducible genes activator [Rhizobium paknamense]MDQ0457470.1 LysR family hydrogen peroxide-inducible transcriptional activator [Rhizobium paknamense]
MKPAPNLRHLGYLLALAEYLNFSRAADACLVTQSTLSAGIRELETLIGGQLAERTKRQVMLTPLGRLVCDKARMMLQLSDELVDLGSGRPDMLTGRLEIGVIPTVGPFLLPRLMPAIRRRYPDLELGWREDKTTPLMERLRAGQLDALLMAFPHAVNGLETMVLFEDVYHFVCHADHPLATAETVDVEDLPQLDLLLLEKDHCLHAHAIPLLTAAAGGTRSNFSATSLHTLVAMVGEGQGATLLPTIAIEAGLHEAHSSVVVPIAGQTQARQIGLVWRGQSPRASAIRELGFYLRHQLKPKQD